MNETEIDFTKIKNNIKQFNKGLLKVGGKLVKFTAITSIGLATGLIGIGLLEKINEQDYPLE